MAKPFVFTKLDCARCVDAIDVKVAVLERRIRGETNQAIRELIAKERDAYVALKPLLADAVNG